MKLWEAIHGKYILNMVLFSKRSHTRGKVCQKSVPTHAIRLGIKAFPHTHNKAEYKSVPTLMVRLSIKAFLHTRNIGVAVKVFPHTR